MIPKDFETLEDNKKKLILQSIINDPDFFKIEFTELADFFCNKDPLSEGMLLLIIHKMFSLYHERIRLSDFDMNSVINQFFLLLKDMIPNIYLTAIHEYKKEVHLLIKLKRELVTLNLLLNGALDYFSMEEKRNIFSDFTVKTIATCFQKIELESDLYREYDSHEYEFEQISTLGEFGMKVLVEVFKLPKKGDRSFYLMEEMIRFFQRGLKGENLEILRKELCSYLITLDYPEIMEFFERGEYLDVGLIAVLEKKDFKVILEAPNYDFIAILTKMIDSEKFPPYIIEDIIKYLGPQRVKLYLNFIRHVEYIDLKPFEEMKKDLYESFLRDVIFNKNHYLYEGENKKGESFLCTLYKIFFDSMSQEQLEKVVSLNNYELITTLINIENDNESKELIGWNKWNYAHDIVYFLYFLFPRVQNRIIREITPLLQSDLKETLRNYFSQDSTRNKFLVFLD